MLKHLLYTSPFINPCNDGGITPLHCAAFMGHGMAAGWLLERGATVFARDHSGLTPLFRAVQRGNLHMVEILLSHGAYDCHQHCALPHKGSFIHPLHLAHMSCSYRWGAEAEVRTTCLDNIDSGLCAGYSPLHQTCVSSFSQSSAILQSLLTHRPDLDVNPQTLCSHTPLHYAASFGKVDHVKLLCQHGAVLDIHDVWGCTPLILALCNAQVTVAAYLARGGARLNVKDQCPRSLDMQRKKCFFRTAVNLEAVVSRTSLTLDNLQQVLTKVLKPLHRDLALPSSSEDLLTVVKICVYCSHCPPRVREILVAVLKTLYQVVGAADAKCLQSLESLEKGQWPELVSLKRLCRQCVRSRVVECGAGTHVVHSGAFQKLPLPPHLQQYVTEEDIITTTREPLFSANWN